MKMINKANMRVRRWGTWGGREGFYEEATYFVKETFLLKYNIRTKYIQKMHKS